MTFEYDEKGKIFTDIVSKISVLATIQTTTHLMRGHVHVRRDQRIKDELDANQTLFQTPFLAVQRSHIIWVMPEQKQDEERTS